MGWLHFPRVGWAFPVFPQFSRGFSGSGHKCKGSLGPSTLCSGSTSCWWSFRAQNAFKCQNTCGPFSGRGFWVPKCLKWVGVALGPCVLCVMFCISHFVCSAGNLLWFTYMRAEVAPRDRKVYIKLSELLVEMIHRFRERKAFGVGVIKLEYLWGTKWMLWKNSHLKLISFSKQKFYKMLICIKACLYVV